MLDAAEAARAARYRSEAARIRFQVARGALRELLSRYCNVPAKNIAFETNEFGKPQLAVASLAAPVRQAGLEFNLSHSGDVIAIAIARGFAVGVDVERIESSAAPEVIARHCFTQAEIAALSGLAEPERVAAFYRLWCCKEAFLKCLGIGLSCRLDSFELSLQGCSAIPCVEAGSELAKRWHAGSSWWIETLSVVPGYALALAAQVERVRVVCRQLLQP